MICALSTTAEPMRRAPLIERSGRFIIRGNSSEIDRQLKAMIAVEARMGRWPGKEEAET